MLAVLACRLATIFSMAIWWGGLTFYATVVVPTGAEVLGGHIDQGFITRHVSKTINLLGAGTLLILLWNLTTTWRQVNRPTKFTLAGTWLVMMATQAVLFLVYPHLDALLNAETHEIAEPYHFHSIHEFYISVVGVQWFAGLLHLSTAVCGWCMYQGVSPLRGPYR
jgi:hypothetical protein